MMQRAKFSISPLFQPQIKQAVLARYKADEKTEQSCAYRLDISTPAGKIVLKQYTNGTLYLEGKDIAALISLVEETTGAGVQAPKSSSKTTTTSSSTVSKPTSLTASQGEIFGVPYIGTDESGKGDYFGPLVIAGVYVTPDIIDKLKSAGVADSKMLNDTMMKSLTPKIKELVGENAWHIIEIGPKRYNELYQNFKSQGKSLNDLLAWGHAMVIEELLKKNPTCTQAIADQFGSERFIKSQLKTLGKAIHLHQMHKAESNMGVAAASILARTKFVEKLSSLGNQFNMRLPLGAGDPVLKAGRQFVSTHGKEALVNVAKLHFKTTEAFR